MVRALIIILLVAAFLAAAILLPQISHNRQLTKFEASYADVTHPQSSQRMIEFSEVGLLGGANGNHCDFLVGEIREYNASEDLIRAHYASQQIKSPLEPSYSLAATVVFLSEEYRDDPILQYEIAPLVGKARSDRSLTTLYVIYFLDAGHDPNFDIRCH